MEQNVFNEFDIVGIVLADREPEENESIEGIPVVSKIDTLTEYIQTRWVDALLVGIKKKTLIPEDLFETNLMFDPDVKIGALMENAMVLAARGTSPKRPTSRVNQVNPTISIKKLAPLGTP